MRRLPLFVLLPLVGCTRPPAGDPAPGKAFTNGTTVQVFLLAGSVPTDTWSGSVPRDQT